MKFGQVFQSINVWQKLTRINLRPTIAFKLLRYSKLVEAEYNIFEEKRRALIQEVAGTGPDFTPDTVPEGKVAEFMEQLNAMAAVDCDLSQCKLDLSDVVDAAEEKGGSLTVRDLALVEPFFQDYDDPASKIDPAADEEDPCPCDTCHEDE